MRPELHPDAAKSFDERAQVLLAAAAPEPRQVPSKPPTHTFRPEGASTATIDVGDLGNLKITGKSDQLGRPRGTSITRGDGSVSRPRSIRR